MQNRFDIPKKITAVVLVFSFVVPAFLLAPFPGQKIQRAQAITVHDPIQTIQSTISAVSDTLSAASDAITSAAVASDRFKEFVLDPIAWFAAKILIKHITRSIVNWINSGFEGSPAFVTDLGGFLRDVADQEIGNLIYGSELGFLCDPFQLQIRQALILRYGVFQDQINCRLSDVVTNVDSFLSGIPGSFNDGGWNGWFQVVTEDNPYGRYLEVEAEVAARVANAQSNASAELSFGNGFFSWKECTPRAAAGSHRAAEEAGTEDCEIVTPGSFIEGQLENVAGSGIRQLELADEFNEIISALVVQLISQVLGGGGLRGLSTSRNGGGSYLDQLAVDTELPGGGGSLGTDAVLDVGSQFKIEQSYKDAVIPTLERVRATERTLLELKKCDASRADPILNAEITPLRSRLETELSTAENNAAILQEFDARMQAATTISETEAILSEYNNLARTGAFHSISESSNATIEQQTIGRRLGEIDAQAQSDLRNCELSREGGAGSAEPGNL